MKPEEEEAITYSENRPNCPRPRSYGSPHCRDAGAKRAIPFLVTFSSGADGGQREKNGLRDDGTMGRSEENGSAVAKINGAM